MGWKLFADASTLAKMGKAQILPDLFKLDVPVVVTGTILAEIRAGAALGNLGSQRALTWIQEHRNGPLLSVAGDEPGSVPSGQSFGEISINAEIQRLKNLNPADRFLVVGDDRDIHPLIPEADRAIFTHQYEQLLVSSGSISYFDYALSMKNAHTSGVSNWVREPGDMILPGQDVYVMNLGGIDIVGVFKVGTFGIEVESISGLTKSVNLTERFSFSENAAGVTEIIVNKSLNYPSFGVNCFPAGTKILLSDNSGGEKRIEKIQPGDLVAAYNEAEGIGGALLPRLVNRTFIGVTDEWLKLSSVSGEKNGLFELTVTPGHRFLASDGMFRRIDQIIAADKRIVLADGSIVSITAERVVYSAETAHLYEEAESVEYVTIGSTALAPKIKLGWKTYNFEVDELHTYVAGGVRVHNDSYEKVATLAVEKGVFEAFFGRQFTGSESDFGDLLSGIASGQIPASGDFVDAPDRFTAPFDNSPSKIVISGDESGVAGGTVTAGFLQHITALSANGQRIDTAFAPDGSRIETKTDTANHFDWNREVTAIHPDFIDKIVINDDGAVASPTWNGAEVAGNIGAMFGSQLGTYLGGNSLTKLAAGTVLGAIGKEVGTALTMGASYSLELAVKNAFGTLGNGSGIGSLPAGAIGAASSLLMAELAQALHLSGWEGWAFTTTGTSITTQLVTNAFGMATGATWGNGNPYTMYTGFDPASIATNLGTVVAAKLASTLVSQVVLPHYPEGAVGQQIGASIGGSIGATLGAVALVGIPVVGPVMGAYIGSFLGSIAGSIIGDLAGNDPESRGRVVFLPDGRFYPDPSSFWGDHGATGDTFMHIATHTALTLNALADFAGVTMSAFPVDANPISNALGLQLIYTQDNHYWMINEPFRGPLSTVAYPHGVDELSPLINTGITTLAHRVTVAGGDPLVRLAWQNSHANNASAFALDLQTAKDYRLYLDDKDMIDLMIAAAPESAFAGGWIVTLLKAHELGLDAAPASEDFRNGNDLLNGTAAADFLVGGAGHDIMNGGGGDDRLRGDAGNDSLNGGSGNDVLIGGAGFDTAFFSGQFSVYALNDLGNGLISVSGPDGADTLVEVERLQFADRTVDLPLFRDLAATLSLSGTTANVRVRNSGTFAANASVAALYLSTDSTVTTADTPIATSTIAAISAESIEFRTLSFALPAGLSPGTYYLAAIADAGGVVAESNEANNVSAVAAILVGDAAANTLAGTSAGDTIFGLAGNDAIDGGPGFDTAVFTGARSAYTITRTATTLTVVGPDGSDTLTRIEKLAFADTTVAGLMPPPLDFGGDRQSDLLWRNDNGELASWQLNNGVYGGGQTFGIQPAEWHIAGFGDFNGDGTTDIMWRNETNGQVDTWTMSNGGYAGGNYFGLQSWQWHILGFGDFNGDGTTDVLWQHDDGRLDTWEIQNGVYAGGRSFGIQPAQWHVVGLGDFNGDGTTDILWRDDNGRVDTWEMKNGVYAGGKTLGTHPLQWKPIGFGDFNGDGTTDMLWRNDNGHVATWQMNNGAYGGGVDFGVIPNSWHFQKIGDFNGDGTSDILWRHDSGQLDTWEMTNGGYGGGQHLGLLSSDWHIQ